MIFCRFLLIFLYLDFILAIVVFIFFFKQKTAYEMRISDWSSDVCSSDLANSESLHDYEDRIRGTQGRPNAGTVQRLLAQPACAAREKRARIHAVCSEICAASCGAGRH